MVSCNTFETFVVTISWNCHGFNEFNCRHSHIQSILGQAHNPCNSCSMFRGEFSSHLRTVTPISFLLHSGTQWRGNTSTVLHMPTHATMTARVFDLAVLHFHSIPEFYRGRQLSSPNHYLFNKCFFSHIRSSRKPVLSKSSTCTQSRMSRASC